MGCFDWEILNLAASNKYPSSNCFYINKFYSNFTGGKNASFKTFFLKNIATILDDQSNCSREELSNAVNELIAFDIQIAQLTKSKESRYDYDRIYNLRRLSDMNTLVPVVILLKIQHNYILDKLDTLYD